MLKYFVFSFVILLASFANCAEIVIDQNNPSYHNQRFGFAVAWSPGKYQVYEAENGDGITVTDDQGLKMQVYADLSPRVEEQSLDDFLKKAKAHPQAPYLKVDRANSYYALSYIENDKIIYIKQYYGQDHYPTLYFEYPKKFKKFYDKLVNSAVRSFRPSF